MRLLIIEDEPRAANQLQQMLKKSGHVYELLDTIDSVEEAVSWFKENDHPDLVFMDIQLADGLSFEIFQDVKVEVPIIFTTAFDQYAIRAFKVNSIDYLLKPIQEDDLESALKKFKKSTNQPVVDQGVFQQLLSSIQGTKKREGILVKKGSGYLQLKISELIYFYSEESITFGVTSSSRFIIDETMDQLFSSLDASQFFRINRGQIVSKDSIKKIENYFNHRVKLTVRNQRDLDFVVSRSKTSDFKAWLNQ